MHQQPAVGILLQQLGGILPRQHGPQHVHLEEDGLRVGLGHQQIEERPLAIRLELVAMVVIVELDAVLGQGRACPVEHRGRRAALLLVEGIRVIDPRATDVGKSQRLGIPGDAFDVIAEPGVGEMAADRHQPAPVELRLELGGRQSAQVGHLDVLEAEGFGLVQRGRHALRFLHVAQAVELQAGRALEALAHAHVARHRQAARKNRQYRRHHLQSQKIDIPRVS